MTTQSITPTLKLYGSYTSPFVRHCRVILLDNNMVEGVDYEFVETDIKASSKGSATRRVPFMQDSIDGQSIKLHDSSSIAHYLRDKAEQEFLTTAYETDVFSLANTILDTLINLFLLERSGISHDNNPYLERHFGRAQDSLALLDDLFSDTDKHTVDKLNDAYIRVACMIEWCQFRNRADMNKYPNLLSFLEEMNTWDTFAITSPSNTP